MTQLEAINIAVKYASKYEARIPFDVLNRKERKELADALYAIEMQEYSSEDRSGVEEIKQEDGNEHDNI